MKNKKQLLAVQQTIYNSRNPTRRWLHNRRKEWIESQLEFFRGKNIGTAMEVGPGSGIYLPKLAEISTQAIAIDIEPAYLEQAESLGEEIGNLRCYPDDITNSTFAKSSCDLVLCTEVIEHIADSQLALSGIRGLLSPQGTLILTTPQKFSPLEICAKIAFLPGIIQLVRIIYGEPIEQTGHINLLTEDELRQQLETAGFEIMSSFKCGFYLPLVAEFGGMAGLAMLQSLERFLRGTPLDCLLWTQCYILRCTRVSAPNHV
jgi:2-polyprenyl-3-methyl-5-hydroxy-6-metoxy-1,4-benzoquinol methylase